MMNDVVDLRSFYASPLGAMARRFIGRAAMRLWSDCTGGKVMGLGYAAPYLPLFNERSERLIAFMPAQQGVVNWPATGPSASTLIDPTMLPLDDSTIDRIMVVHGIETAENPTEMLEECWRVLAPGGRLMVVAPNRGGLWARMDVTPFGHGRPYSRRQLEALMRAALFSPENWTEALFVPPLKRHFVLRSAVAWEKVGLSLSLPFAGVHVIDATKQFYRRAPAKAKRSFAWRQIIEPLPAPAPSPGRSAARETRMP